MFVEIVGRDGLPDEVDRDDIEDLLAASLGADGEVTGAGTGMGVWNLDIEITADGEPVSRIVQRLAAALVGEGLSTVSLRVEGWETGVIARDLTP